MSVSDGTSQIGRPISIRYIAKSTSDSYSSSPTRSFAWNKTSFEPDVRFITLEDAQDNCDCDGDAIESANEVDEVTLVDQSNSAQKDADEDEGERKKVGKVSISDFYSTEDEMDPNTNSVHLRASHFDLISNPNCGYSPITFLPMVHRLLHRQYSLPLFRIRLFFGFLLVISFFFLPAFLTGLFTGVYISLVVFLFTCVSEPIQTIYNENPMDRKLFKEIIETKQNVRNKIYKGWMNILDENYNPHSFHVNTIQTVLVRLDGNLLRISRPEKALIKHTIHNDPTLTEPEPRMLSQNIFDLTNASIRLRPQRLARRRWFSRKYPICIRLAKMADVEKRVGNCTLRYRQAGLASSKNNRATEMAESMSSSSSSEGEEEYSLGDGTFLHSHSEYSVDTGSEPAGIGRQRSLTKRTLFLFGRSAREKERWFHRLRQASSKYHKENLPMSNKTDNQTFEQPPRSVSLSSFENIGNKFSKDYVLYSMQDLQFSRQLISLISAISEQQQNPVGGSPTASNGMVLMDLGRNKWTSPVEQIDDHFVVLVNLIASRVFYDFCRDKYWCGAVRNRIQTKLATIHLPYFIETLELSKFDLGTSTPKIIKVFKPIVDEWGIWCDFEIKYNGLIKLMLETRVNLMKLKSVSESSNQTPTADAAANISSIAASIMRTSPSRYSDDEIPESPETSPDEEFGTKLKNSDSNSRRLKTGQKIMNIVDKVTHSKYFKEAAELKPIRKMMEEISSTRLVLNVEVTALEGILTCNFPPPPSDRLWYGFRQPPQMSIRAIPQVGDRSVVFSTLSEWIEKKLQLILEKNLVLPNMDDVVIPVMSGNALLQGNLNR